MLQLDSHGSRHVSELRDLNYKYLKFVFGSDSSQEELLVKLYDYNGVDVLELMQMRIRTQLEALGN